MLEILSYNKIWHILVWKNKLRKVIINQIRKREKDNNYELWKDHDEIGAQNECLLANACWWIYPWAGVVAT